MHLIAALTLIGILTLIFAAAAYFGESQQPNQPRTQRRYYIGRCCRPWPAEPTPRKLSFREQIWYRAELERRLQKSKHKHNSGHSYTH